MKVFLKNMELRGIEQKEYKSGLYHLYNLEDQNGNHIGILTKNLNLINGKNKGEKFEIECEYNSQYGRMQIIDMQKLK